MVSLNLQPVFFAEVRFAEVRGVAFALTFRSLFDKTVCILYCVFLVCGFVCGDFMLEFENNISNVV